MASQSLLLKAQLLAPTSPQEAEDARGAAARRLELLDEFVRMRAGADWLAARPQLGRAMFAEGQGTPPQARPRAELYVAFLDATLTMLEGREGRTTETIQMYEPRPPDIWRILDARQRVEFLLPQNQHGLLPQHCLPPISRTASGRALRLRAALASTFVAGLEMTREGVITSAQTTRPR